MVKADFITGLALMGLSVYVMIESWLMPRMEHINADPLSAPGIVPGFLAAIIFILGFFLALRSVLCGGWRLDMTTKKLSQFISHAGNRRLLIALILCLGYAGFAMGTLPFWLATAIFVFLFIVLFEWDNETTKNRFARKIVTAAVIAIVTAAVVTVVFEKLFLVTLP